MATLTGKRACPFCGKRIQAAAYKCMFCGAFLEASEGRPAAPPVEDDEPAAPGKGSWMAPADQSGWAVAAGYCGVLALLPVLGLLIGLAAIVMAIVALRQLSRHPALGGQWRAGAGLVLGTIGTLYNVFVVAAMVLPTFAGHSGPAPRF